LLSLGAAIALLIDDFLTWQEGGESMIDWGKNFGGIIKWIIDLVKTMVGALSSAGSAVSGFFGSVGKMLGFGGGAPASTPSPQAQAAVPGGSQSVSQQTQTVVQGAGNPDATAKAVAGQQGRVNADMARNMKGAAK